MYLQDILDLLTNNYFPFYVENHAENPLQSFDHCAEKKTIFTMQPPIINVPDTSMKRYLTVTNFAKSCIILYS